MFPYVVTETVRDEGLTILDSLLQATHSLRREDVWRRKSMFELGSICAAVANRVCVDG
jgi:hypothetical protein